MSYYDEPRYQRGDIVESRRSGRRYSITDDNGGPYVGVYEPNQDWSSSVTIHRFNLRPVPRTENVECPNCWAGHRPTPDFKWEPCPTCTENVDGPA